MKTDLFQSCGHCWVFQICWHIECSTFTASSFRIRNSSTGIPSPPLALFIVMLSKAHLTSHSRMSGSRWVITPSWLSCIFIIIPMHIPMCYSYAYSLLFLLWLISLTGLQSPSDSQESSPASQLESINSSPLSLLYGPTLTSVHDSWKKHSFDYMDLYQQTGVSAF